MLHGRFYVDAETRAAIANAPALTVAVEYDGTWAICPSVNMTGIMGHRIPDARVMTREDAQDMLVAQLRSYAAHIALARIAAR